MALCTICRLKRARALTAFQIGAVRENFTSRKYRVLVNIKLHVMPVQRIETIHSSQKLFHNRSALLAPDTDTQDIALASHLKNNKTPNHC